MGINFFGDTEAAEDAVQEALIKLWAAWQQLPSKVDAERLALRLTKYACIDIQRRQHTDVMQSLEAMQKVEVVSSRTASEALQERELREAVARAASLLRPYGGTEGSEK